MILNEVMKRASPEFWDLNSVRAEGSRRDADTGGVQPETVKYLQEFKMHDGCALWRSADARKSFIPLLRLGYLHLRRIQRRQAPARGGGPPIDDDSRFKVDFARESLMTTSDKQNLLYVKCFVGELLKRS